MVKTRFDAQAVPPSTCVTLVESKPQLSLARTSASTSASPGMLAGLHPNGVVPCGALIPGGVVSAVQVYVRVLVARFWQASVTMIVKTRFDAQAVPPSTCVTFVESRPQLSLARTNASTSASPGMLAGLQPSGVVPCGALIPGGVVSAVQV